MQLNTQMDRIRFAKVLLKFLLCPPHPDSTESSSLLFQYSCKGSNYFGELRIIQFIIGLAEVDSKLFYLN